MTVTSAAAPAGTIQPPAKRSNNLGAGIIPRHPVQSGLVLQPAFGKKHTIDLKPVFTLSLLCLTSLFAGCASIAQRAVLPGAYLQAPRNIVQPSSKYELVTLHTKDGTKVMAQFGTALDGNDEPLAIHERRPTVVFFYGNRMCIAGSQVIFGDFRRMGVNILIPDYPGYAMSEGTPSEQRCYAAADAAYDYLMHRDDIDHSQIVVAGLSIGSGPAVDLSSRERVAGLILIVPFTNTRALGYDDLPWYSRWVVPLLAPYAAFDNLAKIPRVSCPILFVQASRDQVTPARRSDELAAAVTAKLTRVVVDADHDGSWKMGRPEIEKWLHANLRSGDLPPID